MSIAKPLYDLARSEIAPGTGLDPDAVWTSFGNIVTELGPENRRLLDMRARHEKGLMCAVLHQYRPVAANEGGCSGPAIDPDFDPSLGTLLGTPS